jgi:hypothetical protein
LEHRADFSVSLIIFTDGRTPWTGDQLVARPLPTLRTTRTQNKSIHTPNIHVLCGIRNHDPGFRASEDSTCLRPIGYRDRLAAAKLWKCSACKTRFFSLKCAHLFGNYTRLKIPHVYVYIAELCKQKPYKNIKMQMFATLDKIKPGSANIKEA